MLETLKIEEEIIAKNLTSPRITPQLIESKIKNEEYHILNKVLTICILTLENDYVVTGESACASPENFDKEIGEKIARNNAIEKIWPLEGYLLKEKLYQREKK